MKPKVDAEKCIGCGACAGMCPEVFKLDEETHKSEVVSEDCGDCDCEAVKAGCPVGAISLE